MKSCCCKSGRLLQQAAQEAVLRVETKPVPICDGTPPRRKRHQNEGVPLGRNLPRDKEPLSMRGSARTSYPSDYQARPFHKTPSSEFAIDALATSRNPSRTNGLARHLWLGYRQFPALEEDASGDTKRPGRKRYRMLLDWRVGGHK